MLFFIKSVLPDMDLSASELAIYRGFGVAALTMAMVSVLVLGSPDEDRVFFFGILLLMIYHLGQTIVQSINAYHGYTPLPIAAMHGFLYFAFTLMFMRKRAAKGQAKPS